MPELRLQVTVEGTDTAGDYNSPSPSRDSGKVVIASIDRINERIEYLGAGESLTLDSAVLRGGVTAPEFVAIHADNNVLVGRTAGAEEWSLKKDGWMVVGPLTTCSTIRVADDGVATTADKTKVLIIIGGD